MVAKRLLPTKLLFTLLVPTFVGASSLRQICSFRLLYDERVKTTAARARTASTRRDLLWSNHFLCNTGVQIPNCAACGVSISAQLIMQAAHEIRSFESAVR